MMIPVTDADGILLDLRYASVDDELVPAVYARPPGRELSSALSAADVPGGPT